MLPSEIRELILAEHRRVAPLLDAVEACARLVLIGRGDEAELRSRAHELELQLSMLLSEERELLHPELRKVDAWGAERARQLDIAHHQQRVLLARTRLAAEQSVVAPRQLAERLLEAAASIRDDLRQEEKQFLSPDLLRDDVVSVAQSDG